MDVLKSKEHQTHHTSTYCTRYAVPTKGNAPVIFSSTCVSQYHDPIIPAYSIEHDLVHWERKPSFRFMFVVGSFYYIPCEFGEDPKNTSSKSPQITGLSLVKHDKNCGIPPPNLDSSHTGMHPLGGFPGSS